jgi:hypothetical protein
VGLGQRARAARRARAPSGARGGCALRCSAPSASISPGRAGTSGARGARTRPTAGVEQLAIGFSRTVTAWRAATPALLAAPKPGCVEDDDLGAAAAGGGPLSLDPESTTTSWVSDGTCSRREGSSRCSSGPSRAGR